MVELYDSEKEMKESYRAVRNDLYLLYINVNLRMKESLTQEEVYDVIDKVGVQQFVKLLNSLLVKQRMIIICHNEIKEYDRITEDDAKLILIQLQLEFPDASLLSSILKPRLDEYKLIGSRFFIYKGNQCYLYLFHNLLHYIEYSPEYTYSQTWTA